MQRITLVRIAALAIACSIPITNAFGQSTERPTLHRIQPRTAPAIVHGPMSTESRRAMVAAGASQLPVWNYQVVSSRDGNLYQGVIVGHRPSLTGTAAAASVPAQIVPVILNFDSVATSIDLSTGIFATAHGKATSDPTVPDTGCFSGSANVPVKLLAQSPLVRDADFNFGGTDVGTTQYTDAFQRGEFWRVIDKNNYHVRLSPVQVFAPVVLNVPVPDGFSIPPSVLAEFFPMCGNEGIVNIDFLDAFVVSQLSKLKGITPGTFPMFMFYNTGMAFGNPRSLSNCCAGGYHSVNPVGPLAFQTYSPFDFDVSGFFVASANDTAIASHEVAEWMNDPYIANDTPAWGNTGQVIGCQGNLEVGDPLTGTEAPRVSMPNGYTYHLQELAFFSWFFGNPSLGIHQWDSNNGTFLTDAGPPCQ
jgi:hypothetical protein